MRAMASWQGRHFELSGRFILSFFVSILCQNFSHGPFQTDACAVCAWLRDEAGLSNRPDVSSCPSLFLYHGGTSRTVCFKTTHAQFIASPSGLGLAVEAGLRRGQSRRGKTR